MSFLMTALYLHFLFSLGAYHGGDPSRLFRSNAEVDDDGAFLYALTKKQIAIPKIRLVWVIPQFTRLVIAWMYGAIAYVVQIALFELLNRLSPIEINLFFDASEYLVSWIYGAVMTAGYFAGRASLYQFSAVALIEHSNKLNPQKHPDLDITYRKAFSSGYQRVQAWKERKELK